MFKKVDPKQSLPKLEEEIQKFWEENDIFKRSVEQRPKKKEYIFYDGPPYANGMPHYGHLLSSTIKDVVPRYQAMRGFRVERRFGWDCHGLPVETEVEKTLGLATKKDIEKLGVGKFNAACRESVMALVEDWQRIIKRLGRFVDFENDYKTMDIEYMESIIWSFKELYDKDLVYKDLRTSFYCTRCETPLSNFEIAMDNSYEMLQDPSVTVEFLVVKSSNVPAGSKLLAWTTTPWTLPSNFAIAAHPEVTYVVVRSGDDRYVLAKDRLDAYKDELGEYEIEKELSGTELAGTVYEPLFDFYADRQEEFRVVMAEYVSTEDGTGMVHIAPAYGEEDFNLGKSENLPMDINPLNPNGTFTGEVAPYEGEYFLDANKHISADLKEAGKLFQARTVTHSVGVCWRCGTQLIYKTQPAYFVNVQAIKDDMIKNNEDIDWHPEHLKNGRFKKGLESAPDWNITRNRFWGTPIPIWECDAEGCEERQVFGSVAEIEKASGQKVDDLHRPMIDEVTYGCPEGNGTMRRTPEILDVWFDSGSMPYAFFHYPFENEKRFKENQPADFIAEYIAQTRGWFYSLHVLSTALFNKPAFRHSVTTGTILAEDGQKMSKSKKNFPDPEKIFHEHGADATRFYMMASPVMNAQNLNFSEDGVRNVVKNVLLPFWNSYSFFVTYANIDGFEAPKKYGKKENKLDAWMLSELNVLVGSVTDAMESYDVVRACAEIEGFIDKMTNWYVRRSRRRFWKSEDDQDKTQAYETLHETLVTFAKLIAPFTPFVADAVYKNLTGGESVHLEDWPEVNKKAIDEDLNHEMNTLRLVVGLGLAARAKTKMKVRQPLAKIELVVPEGDRELIENNREIILQELNVKDVVLLDAVPDTVTVALSPDARKLGPKFGRDMQQIIQQAKAGNFEEAADRFVVKNAEGDDWELARDEAELTYTSEEGKAVEAARGVVVALDTELTEQLVQEGLARDIVRVVQDLRKEAGLEVENRIELAVASDSADITEAVNSFRFYIAEETLADDVTDMVDEALASKETRIQGNNVTVLLKKVD